MYESGVSQSVRQRSAVMMGDPVVLAERTAKRLRENSVNKREKGNGGRALSMSRL
jgi:hypothetical protein